MQTILGANGIIANELAKELHSKYTNDIRLVSRDPKKINDTDELIPADLLDPCQTSIAVKGSEIVYLTAGLPYNSKIWHEQWPIVMRNVIDACKLHHAKLVFFDNVYMYGQVKGTMTEETPFNAVSIKGKVRGEITQMLLDEIKANQITAMICRAPEFYGPRNTKSGTNSTIFYNIKKGKKLQVLLNDNTLRTLIYAPDAAKATALLGNTPDAYNQTWHLPVDTNRMTAKQFIAQCSSVKGKELKYTILKKGMIKIVGLFNPFVKEIIELLYQWEQDYIFDCSKFNTRFPEFKITTILEGIKEIINEFE
ncbi:MAG: NAD-dependent epimerase/dehydratase family protein [Bacteroidales bacterium]|nr:NAD-dependent epimerase/dehydratase family protein [Bacteroidales bacterium]